MTFEKFSELWAKAGLNNPPKFNHPQIVDRTSPELEEALIACADGDHSHFELARRIRRNEPDALNANSPLDRGWVPVSKEATDAAIQKVLDKATKRDEL